MGKSQRERRRQRRRKAAAEDSPIQAILRLHHQKYGALGLISCVAHLAAEDNPESAAELMAEADPLAKRTKGLNFVKVLENNPSKLSAGALAAIAEIWPDELVRQSANESLQHRRTQLSGLMRTLGSTNVACVWRLTNEYRDSEVLLIELAAMGRHVATVAAITDSLRRGWMSVDVLATTAEASADGFSLDYQGHTEVRQVFEEVAIEEARHEIWMLTARKRVEGEPAGRTLLGWCAKILEVDCPWPEIPEFGPVDFDDGGIDFEDELSTFLWSNEGRSWSDDRFDDVIDHLRMYESCERELLWSPARVENFLLFTNHDETGGYAHVLPALLRGWVAHCAKVRRQRKPLLMEVLAEIDRCEPRFLADAA